MTRLRLLDVGHVCCKTHLNPTQTALLISVSFAFAMVYAQKAPTPSPSGGIRVLFAS